MDNESRPTSTIFTPVLAPPTNSLQAALSAAPPYTGIVALSFLWDEARRAVLLLRHVRRMPANAAAALARPQALAQVLPVLPAGQDVFLVLRTATSTCTVLISQEKYRNLGQGGGFPFAHPAPRRRSPRARLLPQ